MAEQGLITAGLHCVKCTCCLLLKLHNKALCRDLSPVVQFSGSAVMLGQSAVMSHWQLAGNCYVVTHVEIRLISALKATPGLFKTTYIYKVLNILYVREM